MLTQWLKNNSLKDVLQSADQYHPYPKAYERTEWDSYSDELRTEAIRLAEGLLNYNWPVLKATQYMEYYRSGSRVASSKPTNARRNALMNLVIGECFEYKGRFINDIIDGIWLICEETTWVVSAHNSHVQNSMSGNHMLPDTQNIYVDLFSAETAALLAWTRYMLKDEIDSVEPIVMRRLEDEIQKRVIIPFLARHDYIWMGNMYYRATVNNWLPWIVSNMLSIILTMETDQYRRIEAFEKICAGVDRFIDIHGEDGGCDEGAHYWTRAGASLYDCLDQISIATGGAMDFFDEEIIKRIGLYISRCHIGGRYFINFADGRPYLSNFCSSLVYLYGKRVGATEMMSLAKRRFKPYTQQQEMSFLRVLPSIVCYKEMSEYTAEDSPERDTWMKDLQVMIARQSSSYDGFFFAAKGGHNSESHNHNDVGSCILFIDGQPAIIDVGVETYTRQTFSAERYKIWTMRSSHHNLPTVNGCEQAPGEKYKADNVVYSMEEDKVIFGLNIEQAYPGETGAESYRREYMFNRTGKPSLTIRDSFVFKESENTLSFSFMTWKEPVIKQNAVCIELPNGTVYSIECGEPSIEIKTETIETQDVWLTEAWGDEGKLYRVVFELNAAGNTGEVSFIIQ